MVQAVTERAQEARKPVAANPQTDEARFKVTLAHPPSVNSDAAVKDYETALLGLGALYRTQRLEGCPNVRQSLRRRC